MKIFIELEGEEEMTAFLAWRRNAKAATLRACEKQLIDERFGRTEIANLNWPPRILAICKSEGLETVEQVAARSDNEWLKTPSCGRTLLKQIRELSKTVLF